jgi:hypothetical protein
MDVFFFLSLIHSQVTDGEGFALLQAIVHVLSLSQLQTYLSAVISVLCTRMQKLKTPKVSANAGLCSNASFAVC